MIERYNKLIEQGIITHTQAHKELKPLSYNTLYRFRQGKKVSKITEMMILNYIKRKEK